MVPIGGGEASLAVGALVCAGAGAWLSVGGDESREGVVGAAVNGDLAAIGMGSGAGGVTVIGAGCGGGSDWVTPDVDRSGTMRVVELIAAPGLGAVRPGTGLGTGFAAGFCVWFGRGAGAGAGVAVGAGLAEEGERWTALRCSMGGAGWWTRPQSLGVWLKPAGAASAAPAAVLSGAAGSDWGAGCGATVE